MTHAQESTQMNVLLVGEDDALLEGLSQSFAYSGYSTHVAITLHEAREAARIAPPLLVVVDSALASKASADALAISLAPGGALVLYHSTVDARPTVAPALLRAVMADLNLPLERNRLMALAQHVHERARATGRGRRTTPPEQQAF